MSSVLRTPDIGKGGSATSAVATRKSLLTLVHRCRLAGPSVSRLRRALLSRFSRGDPGRPLRTVVIDVIDDGPGVPRELRDRIFNAFFTTKPQGSGLGLAIVRRLARDIAFIHQGRLVEHTPADEFFKQPRSIAASEFLKEELP